jgi:hypothetical protein
MNRVQLHVLGLLAALAVGCGAQPEESGGAPRTGVETSETSAVSVLDAYEAVRARLAKDEEPEAGDYEELASAARRTMPDHEGEARANLSELAMAAEAAAAEAGNGLPAARLRFGKFSEPLIAFLSLQPDLAQGRFVFECPMAKGYPKWVQGSDTVSNPYMGLKMASCGAAAAMAP